MDILEPLLRTARRLTLAAAVLVIAGCGSSSSDATDVIDGGSDDEGVYYYVSLGTSLAVGVQPTSIGVLLTSSDGYADQLYDLIKTDFEAGGANRELRLLKLGCPGETVDDMINGGLCPYLAGSQLDAAVDFLAENADKVFLLTIDIGANDFRDADCITDAVNAECINTVSGEISSGLSAVLAALSDAADPATTIVGMNYYNPYLSSWLDNAGGQVLAVESAQASVIFNDALAATYASAGIPMADVYAAFESDDFSTMVSSSLPPPNDILPVNVANICTFTYMCDDPPVGPDIHANVAGYSLIAETLSQESPAAP
jgi:lysophospholipase L1-like esterase